MSVVSPSRSSVSTAWRYVCVSYAVRCVADRSWSFFLPLYLSRGGCGSSLRPTAALSLTQNLAVAAVSTAAANAYQRHCQSHKGGQSTVNRPLQAFVRATLLENAAVVCGGLLLVLFAGAANQSPELCSSPLQSNVYLLALLCGSIDAICSSLLSTVVSKQWVATLFHATDNPSDNPNDDDDNNGKIKRTDSSLSALSSANARLSQIDLVAATLCPLLVSYGIRYGSGYTTVLFLLVGQHAFGAILIVWSIKRALRLEPRLGGKTTNNDKDEKPSPLSFSFSNPFIVFTNKAVPLRAKLVTAAFVLLFCTVLSPGSMMNAWLNSVRQHTKSSLHLSEETIALFGSTSNLFGALATVLTPRCIQWFGLYKAGAVLQLAQTGCVLLAAYTILSVVRAAKNESGYSDNDNMDTLLLQQLLYFGLVPLAVSRVGLWGFDLVERQILQETVPRSQQTVFFNAEKGLTQLVSLGMMQVCYIYADPDSFGMLASLSACAVLTASVVLGVALLL